jgi:hypothetical protein
MCILTRRTGARSGARDPGTSPPCRAAAGRPQQLHYPEPGKNGQYGAREDAHRQPQAGKELNHGASHAPRSLMSEEGENASDPQDIVSVRRRDRDCELDV